MVAHEKQIKINECLLVACLTLFAIKKNSTLPYLNPSQVCMPMQTNIITGNKFSHIT